MVRCIVCAVAFALLSLAALKAGTRGSRRDRLWQPLAGAILAGGLVVGLFALTFPPLDANPPRAVGLVIAGAALGVVPCLGYWTLGYSVAGPIGPDQRRSPLVTVWLLTLLLFFPYSAGIGLVAAAHLQCAGATTSCLFG